MPCNACALPDGLWHSWAILPGHVDRGAVTAFPFALWQERQLQRIFHTFPQPFVFCAILPVIQCCDRGLKQGVSQEKLRMTPKGFYIT